MRLTNDSNRILSANVAALLETKRGVSRLNLAKRMGVADGTLGRIKYGTGNPTVEVIDQIGNFFQVPSWSLLRPNTESDQANTPPLHGAFLVKAIDLAQEAFRQAHRIPNSEQLAAATTLAYAMLLKGQHQNQAAKAVNDLIVRAALDTTTLLEVTHGQ